MANRRKKRRQPTPADLAVSELLINFPSISTLYHLAILHCKSYRYHHLQQHRRLQLHPHKHNESINRII